MPHIEIAAERLIELFGMPITNTLITSWIVVGFLVLSAVLFQKRVTRVPKGAQNIAEFFVEKLLGLMEGVIGSREKAERYFPIVATLFIFILISNWFGIFPGVGSLGLIEEHEGRPVFVPLLRSAASDVNTTLALAAIAVILINLMGIASAGVWRYVSRFISFKGPIDFFVGILEFISEFAKIISFAFRLFGNIFAGEVLLVITAFLIPYFVPIPFLMLELFVGFIQALVFAMLTTVFISIATAEHH